MKQRLVNPDYHYLTRHLGVHDKAEELDVWESLTFKFRENYKGFWETYHLAIGIFTIALLCDALSTVNFMTKLGTSAEFHPLVRFLSMRFGPVTGPMLGAAFKAIACVVVTIYWRRYAMLIFMTASVLYLAAAWYNLWGIYLVL